MVSDGFFLEVTKESGTKLLLQTVAVKPKETLQPISREEERGGREGEGERGRERGGGRRDTTSDACRPRM